MSLSVNCSARNDNSSPSVNNGTNNNSEMESNESSRNESMGIQHNGVNDGTNDSLIESEVEQNKSSSDENMGVQSYQDVLLSGSSVTPNNNNRTTHL